MKRRFLLFLYTGILSGLNGYGQSGNFSLSLPQAIEQAKAHSLSSMVAANAYIADYWVYRQYKAGLMPSLSLTSTPIQYNQNMTKRYDSQQDIDVYKSQRNLFSSIGLEASQAVPFTGGKIYLESDLNYLKNFGSNENAQFTTIPLRLGYSQNLFGYNAMKWDRRIEPKRYEKARQDLLYEMENVACTTAGYFYNLVLQQKNVELCEDNVARCDTTSQIAEERFKIGNGSRAQIHTLRLNLLNAQKSLREARQQLQQARQKLLSFLRYEDDAAVKVFPQKPVSALLIAPEEAVTLAKQANPKMLQMEMDVLTRKQQLEKVKKSRFSTSVSASVGLNQSARHFGKAYADPLHQESVSVSFSVPLLDWGTNRGKIITAEQDLEATFLRNQQTLEDFEQDIRFIVSRFHESYEQIELSAQAEEAARIAYEDTYQQFLSGRGDVDALGMAQGRLNEAGKSYINALAEYWRLYYELRRITLYDFHAKCAVDIDTKRFIH